MITRRRRRRRTIGLRGGHHLDGDDLGGDDDDGDLGLRGGHHLDEDDGDDEDDEDDDDDEDDEDDEDGEDGDGSYSSRVLILLQSFPLKVIPRREWCVCRNKIFKISIPFFLDLAYFQQRWGECTADSTRSSLCTTGVEEEEDHLEFELSITSIVSTKLCNRLLGI